jgi:hypothetical protein
LRSDRSSLAQREEGQSGSDEEANLLTLCKVCHDGLHAGTITLKRRGKKKGSLAHATQMNSIRVQLLKPVQAEETWGFVTKEHRRLSRLPKVHVFDAAVIATRGVAPTFHTTDCCVQVQEKAFDARCERQVRKPSSTPLKVRTQAGQSLVVALAAELLHFFSGSY